MPFVQALVLMLFTFGVIMAFWGIHNMDNAQNLRYVNGIMMAYNTSITFSEYMTMGARLTPDECYLIGFTQTIYGVSSLAMLSLTFVLETFRGRHRR